MIDIVSRAMITKCWIHPVGSNMKILESHMTHILCHFYHAPASAPKSIPHLMDFKRYKSVQFCFNSLASKCFYHLRFICRGLSKVRHRSRPLATSS